MTYSPEHSHASNFEPIRQAAIENLLAADAVGYNATPYSEKYPSSSIISYVAESHDNHANRRQIIFTHLWNNDKGLRVGLMRFDRYKQKLWPVGVPLLIAFPADPSSGPYIPKPLLDEDAKTIEIALTSDDKRVFTLNEHEPSFNDAYLDSIRDMVEGFPAFNNLDLPPPEEVKPPAPDQVALQGLRWWHKLFRRGLSE